MKWLFLRLGVTLLTFSVGIGSVFVGRGIRLLPGKLQASLIGRPHSSELTLRLSTNNTVLRGSEDPIVHIYIANNGNETVTLVQPGDGSESGWRTPIAQWSIVEVDRSTQYPLRTDFTPDIGRCGNINAVGWDEVFRLSPGETKELEEWLPLRKPGIYRVKFLYANRPSIEWQGVVMGTHNPLAMWRIRHSTECTLTSNEVTFTVSE